MKRNKYKLAFAIFTVAVLSVNGLTAQEKHEVSVHVAGGLSTLHYDPIVGKQKDGYGGAAGIGYTYFFNKHWGIGTGVEAALYQGKTKLTGFKDAYGIYDVGKQERANLAVDYKHYNEKQRLITLNVPLMLKYQTGGNHQFYAALGGKVGFPISDKYKVSNAEYDVSAYYPTTNQTVNGPLSPTGYGTYEDADKKGDLDFKIAYFASAEAGVKWKLQEGTSLYTGAYFDYGLNNIDDNAKGGHIVQYASAAPVEMRNNSILNATNVAGEAITNKVRPLAAGIKIALAFGMGSTGPKTKVVRPEVRPAVNYEAERLAAAERAAAEKAATAERARQDELARIQRQKEAAELAAKQKAETEYVQAKKDVAFTLNNFQLGKSAITPAIKTTLDKSIAILKQYPTMKIYSTGFTCDKGTSATNQKVSTQRAETVKNYMVKAGIDATRIVIKAEGEKNPAVPNTNESNRKLNRRVEVEAHQ